ncbi:MAG: hypothetical protein U9Q82_04695 [Chloroflexota bacterium]|nr:hypothetical protein [Chloroflexota bacterium]
MKKWIILLIVISLSSLVLAACEMDAQPTATPTKPPEPTQPPTAIPPTETPLPTETSTPTEPPPPTDTPTPTPEPVEESALEPLPPEPQDFEFETEDGQVLQARYYPAAVNPAPMIVLMHWAPEDQESWNEIAFWLQNRGLSGTSPNVRAVPWLDPTWFPPMLEGQSFGVLTFTFRGCEGGCSAIDPDGWLEDALMAMKTASTLEGVDPERIATFGASIGADGSPDACGPFNAESERVCLGALSLSPGDYLNVPYDHAVAVLEEQEPPKPVWCFYAAGDGAAAQACKSASGDHYQTLEWSEGGHGMMLIDPNIEPNAMELILDWLNLVFEL